MQISNFAQGPSLNGTPVSRPLASKQATKIAFFYTYSVGAMMRPRLKVEVATVSLNLPTVAPFVDTSIGLIGFKRKIHHQVDRVYSGS